MMHRINSTTDYVIISINNKQEFLKTLVKAHFQLNYTADCYIKQSTLGVDNLLMKYTIQYLIGQKKTKHNWQTSVHNLQFHQFYWKAGFFSKNVWNIYDILEFIIEYPKNI